MSTVYASTMKKSSSQLKTKAKRIARDATKAIKYELNEALKDHKMSKAELKKVGGMIAKEAKMEGRKIGDFLRHEFRQQLDKALPVMQAYLAEGKSAVVGKRKRK